MNFNDVFYFTVVAEERGFSAAERKLGVSKSTLSRRVLELEKKLGTQLLLRNSRHLALTRAGSVFYDRCKCISRNISGAVEAVSMLRAKPSGRLRVSCETLLAQYYLSTTLAGFLQEYPDIRVELRATDEEQHPLEAEVDIWITTLPLAKLPQDLIVRKLVDDHYVLAASPDYCKRNGQPRRPEDVARFQTIGKGGVLFGKKEVWLLFSNSGYRAEVAHTPRFSCGDLRAQYHAAVHDAGIAMLPCAFLQDALARNWLLQLLPEWRGQSETVNAVFPASKKLLPSMRVLLDYLGEHLPACMGFGASFWQGQTTAMNRSSA